MTADLPERDEAWFEAVFRAEVDVVWAHVQHVARSIARRGRLADRVGRPRHADDHAQTVADGIDASALVTSALARLSPADRELLRLYAWDQLGVAGR